MHMGLHRSSNASFNPIDAEVRKRLFWSIRKMDTYVGTMLGLPIYLSDEDVDQDWPIEVEDEQITGTTIHSRPGQEIPILAASNAHTRIVQIFAKICKHMYPIKGSQSGAPSVTGLVSCMKIAELENDLERWTCDLPSVFKVGGVVSPTLTRYDQRSNYTPYECSQLMRSDKEFRLCSRWRTVMHECCSTAHSYITFRSRARIGTLINAL
jgi:hypothetical protein